MICTINDDAKLTRNLVTFRDWQLLLTILRASMIIVVPGVLSELTMHSYYSSANKTHLIISSIVQDPNIIRSLRPSFVALNLFYLKK